VLALRRAPRARSLSAVFDRHLSKAVVMATSDSLELRGPARQCTCVCHGRAQVLHPVPCCNPCATCGEHVANGLWHQHECAQGPDSRLRSDA